MASKPNNPLNEKEAMENVKDAAARAATNARNAKDKVSDDVGAQIDVLRADLARLTDSIGALVQSQAHEVSGRVKDTVGQARQQFNSTVNDLGERAGLLADRAQRQATSMSREVEETIERNPMTAVMVALGVGFVVGLFSRNR